MDAVRTRGHLRAWLSRAAHGPGDRPVFRAGYGALVATETALAAAWSARRRVPPADPGNLTVVVKTFERPHVLRRMLASLRRVYAGPVVVADDSTTPFTPDDPGVRVLSLPFDTGVGAGRNALLAAVDTEFVFMADDDMVLLPDFSVDRPLAYLARNPDVDVVGGRVIHLPLWRTADYSAAALFAYPGEPRARQGTLVDGLPVSYKVPNFYVARTAAVRAVGYDDRLKRVDHNDFFTSAYGRLLCVVDPAMVCLHAHSFFDAHYQSFRMDTSADLALLSAKWSGGRTAAAPEASGGLRGDQRVALHHAAVEVVARDLGIVPVHLGTPTDVVAAVRLPAPERGRLLPVLRTLGWAGSTGHLTHPLWGELSVTTGEADGSATPASFATVTGLSADAAAWPPPVARDAGGDPGGRVRWSPRAGFVDDGEVVVGAPLPSGPVLTLGTPGDLVWEVAGPSGRPLPEVVAEVLAAYDDPGPDAAAQLRAYVTDLVGRGLLEN